MANEGLKPTLSQLLPLEKIPNELEGIRDAIGDLLDDIYVNNLIASQSYDGSYGYYTLTLTTANSIGLDIPIAEDLKLVLNPTDQGATEFSVSLDYSWQILKYIYEFDYTTFDGAAISILRIFLNLANVSEKQLLSDVLTTFYPGYDAINNFANEFNTTYGQNVTVLSGANDSVWDKVEDVSGQIMELDYDMVLVTFDLLINVSGDPVSKIRTVFSKYFANAENSFNEATKLNFIATLRELSVGLQFPRKWLVPVYTENEPVTGYEIVDPLAEVQPNKTPYHFVSNNPINLIDPTGMSADPPDGEFGQGHRHTDSDGTKWQLNGSVWENQSGGGDQWQNETLDEITIDIDKKPSKLSADLTNAYSASGLRHGVEWTKNNISFGIYDFLYNNPAVTGYGSGEYGAYMPTSRDVSKGLMTVGDGMMYLGYAGIFSGVGAKPGAGLVAIGSGISSAGLLFDATLDYQDGNTNLALFKISALGLTPLLGSQAKRGARWFNGLNSPSTRVGNTSTGYFIDAQMNYYQGKVIENQENKNR